MSARVMVLADFICTKLSLLTCSLLNCCTWCRAISQCCWVKLRVHAGALGLVAG